MNIVLKHIVLYRKQEEAIKAEQEKTLLMQAKPQVTKFLKSKLSAVHRSRRAGAGVLTYFAGAGAGVCSPPVKL